MGVYCVTQAQPHQTPMPQTLGNGEAFLVGSVCKDSNLKVSPSGWLRPRLLFCRDLLWRAPPQRSMNRFPGLVESVLLQGQKSPPDPSFSTKGKGLFLCSLAASGRTSLGHKRHGDLHCNRRHSLLTPTQGILGATTCWKGILMECQVPVNTLAFDILRF